LDRTWESRQLTTLEKLTKQLVSKRLEVIVHLEEELWRQRAKRTWLKQGDRNTTYFHAVASVQKQKNWIVTIEEEGVQHTKHEDKAKVIHHYFSQLMGSTQNTASAQFRFQCLYSNPLNEEEWQQL
jgi:hypothetical protein